MTTFFLETIEFSDFETFQDVTDEELSLDDDDCGDNHHIFYEVPDDVDDYSEQHHFSLSRLENHQTIQISEFETIEDVTDVLVDDDDGGNSSEAAYHHSSSLSTFDDDDHNQLRYFSPEDAQFLEYLVDQAIIDVRRFTSSSSPRTTSFWKSLKIKMDKVQPSSNVQSLATTLDALNRVLLNLLENGAPPSFMMELLNGRLESYVDLQRQVSYSPSCILDVLINKMSSSARRCHAMRLGATEEEDVAWKLIQAHVENHGVVAHRRSNDDGSSSNNLFDTLGWARLPDTLFHRILETYGTSHIIVQENTNLAEQIIFANDNDIPSSSNNSSYDPTEGEDCAILEEEEEEEDNDDDDDDDIYDEHKRTNSSHLKRIRKRNCDGLIQLVGGSETLFQLLTSKKFVAFEDSFQQECLELLQELARTNNKLFRCTNKQGKTPLMLLCQQFSRTDFGTCSRLYWLCQEYLELFIEAYPTALCIPDGQLLPIHLILSCGLQLAQEVLALHPKRLLTKQDPVTGLYPFLQAASFPCFHRLPTSYDVNLIYQLLRPNPSLVASVVLSTQPPTKKSQDSEYLVIEKEIQRKKSVLLNNNKKKKLNSPMESSYSALLLHDQRRRRRRRRHYQTWEQQQQQGRKYKSCGGGSGFHFLSACSSFDSTDFAY